MAECSLSSLQTDACTNSFQGAAQNEILFRALVLQLLCNIASGGGAGGAAFTAGNYGGLAPGFTPSGSTAFAVDTSTNDLWMWYSSAWH